MFVSQLIIFFALDCSPVMCVDYFVYVCRLLRTTKVAYYYNAYLLRTSYGVYHMTSHSIHHDEYVFVV